MDVLVNCKNEEDPIKYEGARVLQHYPSILRHSRAAKPIIGNGI